MFLQTSIFTYNNIPKMYCTLDFQCAVGSLTIMTSNPWLYEPCRVEDQHRVISLQPLRSLRPSSCQLQPGGSAGHRVATLESLKAGLVGADCCLIVLFRAAVCWGGWGVTTGLHVVWGHSGGRSTDGIQPRRVSLIYWSKGHCSYASVGWVEGHQSSREASAVLFSLGPF